MNSSPSNNALGSEQWPSLDFEAWKDTYATLHMWMQIVGKIRLVKTPWITSRASCDALLLDFLQSSYEAAADLSAWDRAALERKIRP